MGIPRNRLSILCFVLLSHWLALGWPSHAAPVAGTQAACISNSLAEAGARAAKGRAHQPLSEQEILEAKNYAIELGMPESGIVTDRQDMPTSWGEVFGREKLYIGDDLKPSAADGTSLSANQRVSARAAIAHELVGHREAALAGHSKTPKEYGAWSSLSDEEKLRRNQLEEAQASLRAAKFAPGLNKQERKELFRDGIERLQVIGLGVDDIPTLGLYLERR